MDNENNRLKLSGDPVVDELAKERPWERSPERPGEETQGGAKVLDISNIQSRSVKNATLPQMHEEPPPF